MSAQIYNPEKPIVVAHASWEAQQLLRPVLDQWFGDSHQPLDRSQASDCDRWIGRVTQAGQWKKTVRCVSGIFDQRMNIGLPDGLPADYQLVMFVADPFRLTVAEFERQKNQSEFWHRGQRIDFPQKFPSLASFVERHPDWLYARMRQDLTLANLHDKLGTDTLYLGVLERFQDSVNQLATVLGKPSAELDTDWNVAETATGLVRLRREFDRQHPLLKSVHNFAIDAVDRFSQRGRNQQTPELSSNQHAHAASVTTGKLSF